MSDFTPLSALAGGALIGLAAATLLLLEGRIAGVSGILAGVISPRTTQKAWRFAFLFGLIGGGAIASLIAPGAFGLPRLGLGGIAIGGFLVGMGTRVSGGCTSGHGVCGLGRLSPRSLAAVVVFILAGAVTATLVRLARGAA